MKFTKLQLGRVAPEWRDVCLDYDMLKKTMYDAEKRKLFIDVCSRELIKVNTFFEEKLADSKRLFAKWDAVRLAKIDGKFKLVSNLSSDWNWAMSRLRNRQAIERERTTTSAERLKTAFHEFYYEIFLLKEFQRVNVEGFRKILKKRDKTCGGCDGTEWKDRNVDTSALSSSTEVDSLMERAEKAVGDLFDADREYAIKKLRIPTPMERADRVARSIWWVGFGAGLILTFMSTFVASLLLKETEFWKPPWVVARIYRGFVVTFLTIAFYSISVWVWTKCGINYVLILDLNPPRHLSVESICSVATGLLGVASMSLLGFVHLPIGGLNFNRLSSPLFLMVSILVWLLNPLPFAHRRARYWLIRYVVRYLTSPIHRINFVDFWFAEQILSLIPAVLDWFYVLCLFGKQIDRDSMEYKNDTSQSYYVNMTTGYDTCSNSTFWPRPVLASIPYLLIVIQCVRLGIAERQWKHAVNILKYLSAVVVLIVGRAIDWSDERGPWSLAYPYLWFLSATIAYFAMVVWDVRMDWELFADVCKKRKKANTPSILREKLAFKPIFYYAAVVLDALMRVSWLVTISPSILATSVNAVETAITIASVIECVRRCIWNTIYLESEQFKNTEKRCAVRRQLILDEIKSIDAKLPGVMTTTKEKKPKSV